MINIYWYGLIKLSLISNYILTLNYYLKLFCNMEYGFSFTDIYMHYLFVKESAW